MQGFNSNLRDKESSGELQHRRKRVWESWVNETVVEGHEGEGREVKLRSVTGAHLSKGRKRRCEGMLTGIN